MIKFSLVRFFQKIKFSISKSNFNWKDKVFSYLIHDYDEKPEGVERKGLLGPSDSNAGRIRLKKYSFCCQENTYLCLSHLADILAELRGVNIQCHRDDLLKISDYLLSKVPFIVSNKSHFLYLVTHQLARKIGRCDTAIFEI